MFSQKTQSRQQDSEVSGNDDSIKLSELSTSSQRTWGEFFRGAVRSAGLGIALGGAAIGINASATKDAQGGLILNLSEDAAAKQRGADATVDNGGHLAALYVAGADGNGAWGSAIAFNHGGFGYAYSSGHQLLPFNSPTIQLFTGSNYLSNPGQLYVPNLAMVAPGYTGPSSLGTALDLSFYRFDTQFRDRSGNLIGDLNLPTTQLAINDKVMIAGYGQLGVFADQYYGFTGDARAGTSLNFGSSLFNGANPNLYSRVEIDFSDGAGMRGTLQYSGGKVKDLNQLDPDFVRGMMTQASTSVTGTGTQFIDFGTSGFQSQHNAFMSISSVPEPSSIILAGLGALGFLIKGMRQRKNA